VKAASGSCVQPQVSGQYYDAESGKHYNYFRDYDASIGRYLESDPIGLKGGSNTYAYVASRPLSRFDPLGLYDSRMRGSQGNDPYPGCAGNDPSCRSGMPKPPTPPCDDNPRKDCMRDCLTGPLKGAGLAKGLGLSAATQVFLRFGLVGAAGATEMGGGALGIAGMNLLMEHCSRKCGGYDPIETPFSYSAP